MRPTPRLVIELYKNDPTNFGPAQRWAIVEDAIKVGWSWYSRYPASCYFTLRQSSPYSHLITPGLDHLRIWYVSEATGHTKLVWVGRVGDPDESAGDVVWRGYSYLAELALSRTGYRVMYAGKKIARAVRQEWLRDDGKKGKKKFKDYGAKKRTYSLSRFIRTGTIQNPKNDAGKGMKLDPQFGVIDVPRLLFFFDLSEIGRANTRNNVTYEFTREHIPKFNFWRNRGLYIPGLQLNHPGNVRDFRFVPGVTAIRNDLATIGSRRGQAVEIKHAKGSGWFGYERFGRRQDTFAIKTLSGFRNLDSEAGKFSAQRQITRRAVNEATTPTKALQLDVPWQLLEPFRGFEIEDVVDVRLKREDTDISAEYRFIGITGVMDENGYRQTFYVETDDDGAEEVGP